MAAGTAVDLVRLQCPGVAEALAAAQLVCAAREWFLETEWWTKTIETDTVADQTEYDLTAVLEEYGEVQRILSVTLDGNLLDTTAYYLLGQTFVLVTAPDDVYELEVEVVVVSNPTIELTTWDGHSTKSDAVLMSESYVAAALPYSKAMSEYALFLLRSMPGTPWYMPDRAMVHLDRYRDEVRRWKYKLFTQGCLVETTASSSGGFV
jgi:hypothetical protein